MGATRRSARRCAANPSACRTYPRCDCAGGRVFGRAGWRHCANLGGDGHGDGRFWRAPSGSRQRRSFGRRASPSRAVAYGPTQRCPFSRWSALRSGPDERDDLSHRISHRAWWSARRGYVRCNAVEPLFKQARVGSVRLEMRRIDHQAIRGIAGRGQFGEHIVERTKPAAADEAGICRLTWLVRRWCIAHHRRLLGIADRMPLNTRRRPPSLPRAARENTARSDACMSESNSGSPVATRPSPLKKTLVNLSTQLWVGRSVSRSENCHEGTVLGISFHNHDPTRVSFSDRRCRPACLGRCSATSKALHDRHRMHPPHSNPTPGASRAENDPLTQMTIVSGNINGRCSLSAQGVPRRSNDYGQPRTASWSPKSGYGRVRWQSKPDRESSLRRRCLRKMNPTIRCHPPDARPFYRRPFYRRPFCQRCRRASYCCCGA